MSTQIDYFVDNLQYSIFKLRFKSISTFNEELVGRKLPLPAYFRFKVAVLHFGAADNVIYDILVVFWPCVNLSRSITYFVVIVIEYNYYTIWNVLSCCYSDPIDTVKAFSIFYKNKDSSFLNGQTKNE